MIPVKRKKDKFDLDVTKTRVKKYLEETMMLNQSEKDFLNNFQMKEHHPEYLFDDTDIVGRIKNHPMAIWKMQNNE